MFESIEKAFEKLNPLAKAKWQGDHITIRGTVIIHNGNTHIVTQNRIVSQGIKLILGWLCNIYTTAQFYGASNAWNTTPAVAHIRIGSDTTHPTTEDMTALSNEVAIDRNSANVTISKLASGQYRVAWVATWNAGTVSGVCGELGLFLTGISVYPDASLPVTNSAVGNSGVCYLFSRLSSSSGDFVSFTINNAVPLVIEWRLEITF